MLLGSVLVACDDGGNRQDEDTLDAMEMLDGDVGADGVDGADVPADMSGFACGFERCAGGQACCDYACVDTNTDPAHCGGCGVTCGPDETCSAGRCECGGVACGPEEACCSLDGAPSCIDVQTDPSNCGACGNACETSESCLGGQCACLNAQGRFDACGASDTCCSGSGCHDLENDPDNCGGCGLSCGPGELCVAGECTCGDSGAGMVGETACGATEACCGSPATCQPLDDCACGNATCASGEACCLVDPGNGTDACVSTWRDPDYCGDCSTQCETGEACQAGTCVCQPGLADCNGGDDGCETRLAIDPEHCGACGNACAEGEVCDGTGQCTLSCQPGLTDCNGRCVNLDWDREHCGACGNTCAPGEVANGAGVCTTTCLAGLTDCGGECINLNANRFHCGACGVACPPGELCDGTGQCALNCAPGLVECARECVDLTWDNTNCGACGVTCAEGERCESGACVLNCPAGTTECGGGCVYLDSNRYNCGACGNVCQSSYELCIGGECIVDCPDTPDIELCAGKCADTANDRQHCGGCGILCDVGEFCIEGVCQIPCPQGFDACGQECVDLSTSTAHCGACDAACGANEVCLTGQCCDAATLCNGPRDIAVGANYVCGVDEDGRVLCWGRGLVGEDTITPTPIPGIDGATPATTAVDVEAAASHACAIMADQSVMCWGEGADGQLGGGISGASVQRVMLDPGPDPVEKIALAGTVTCAVTTDGRLFCWGSGAAHLAGVPRTYVPLEMPIANVTDVAVLDRAVCAVVGAEGPARSRVNCWGANGNRVLGSLTLDTTDSAIPGEAFVQLDDGTMPPNELTDVADIESYDEYTCALRDDASLVCWGRNREGQLGNDCGDMCESFRAGVVVQVDDTASPPIAGFDAVGVGFDATCAVTVDGRAACWGNNESGQLGHSCSSDDLSGCSNDVSVATLVRNADGTVLEDVAQVETSGGTSCARLISGQTLCWGSNTLGQLGFERQVGGQNELNLSATPTALAGYESTTCAVLPGGTAECWGAAPRDGSYPASLSPAPLGTNDIAQIAFHENGWCVLTTTGSVRCIGANQFGEGGDGCDPAVSGDCARLDTLTTVQGFGTATPVEIGAGWYHMCALMDDQSVMCWGGNWSGQLGDGTTDASGTPVTVNLSGAAAELGVGGDHACARLTTGAVECWGAGWSGQVGNGTYDDPIATPVVAQGIDGTAASASKLGIGEETSCAILADGTVMCWGNNYQGLYGNGTYTSSTTPVAAMTGIDGTTPDTTAVEVIPSYDFTCVLLGDGAVQCTGDNNDDKLGDSSVSERNVLGPALDFDGSTWSATALHVGADHTCAVRASDGAVVCWGSNRSAELGNGTHMSPTPVVIALP